jgi:acyl-homoserine lactone acylase PvdQ
MGTYLKNVNIDSGFITSDGTFGYGAIGRLCKRNIPEMGSFIKNGSTSIYDFGDYYNQSEMPILMNPKRGYITMTNNKFASDNFDLRGSIHEPSNARALRI